MIGREDERLMRAAIALARKNLGRTWPNPSVAALVVDESGDQPVVLGRGITAPGGRPHAEANALAAAGDLARGATLIVTLEPCARRSQSHFGLSCTEMILESGISRVVIGAADPSPFASGQGSDLLRRAGLAVTIGVLEREALDVVRGHVMRVTRNRPFVTLKMAETADGYAGTLDRRPLSITSEATRDLVHRMRSTHDAILTGIGTVLADDPQLDVRLPGMAGYSPLRVVLDSEGRLPPDSRMMQAARPLLVLTANSQAFLPSMLERASGLDISVVPRGAEGSLDLAAALGVLAARGITRLMVEAGPTVAEAFAKAGLIDEFVLLTGPATIGTGLPALGPALAAFASKEQLAESRMIGPDRLRIYRREA